MFTSARQGCAKSITPHLSRPSWSLALHAESSSQAIKRAISAVRPSTRRPEQLTPLRRAHTRARFSAAAAAVISHDQQDLRDTHPYEEEELQLRRTPVKPLSVAGLDNDVADLDRPNSRRPRQIRSLQQPIEPPEPPLIKFRRLVTTKPLSSFLTLPFIPPDQLSTLTLLEIDLLLASLHTSLLASAYPSSIEADDIRSALVQLRGLIHDHPSGRFPGDKMRNKRLYRFLRVALLLDDRDLVRSVWKERMEEQNQRKERLIQPDRFVQILADDLRDWRMILWMFNPRIYPVQQYTPAILERYIQAHLATHQPEAVPRLFRIYEENSLEPTKESHNHLVQALLELGDMDAARLAAQKARTEGGLTADMQQLAILRGHRALGGTAELEGKVLRDVDKLGLEPEAKLINALIRLRMVDGDLDGAEGLLRYFGLGEAGGAGRIRPTGDTMFLALKVASQKRDMDRVGRIWDRLWETLGDITDAHFGVLISTLCHAGRFTEAHELVISSCASSKSAVTRIIEPGIRTLNALLAGLSSTDDLDAIRDILELYSRNNVQPDQRTSSILLSLLDESRYPPEELATFLTSLLDRHPHLRPDISHLDTILSSTLRRQGSTLSSSDSSPTSSGAGLVALEPLQRALRSISQSLQSRSVPSGSKTLALRLRYDALSHGLSGGFPSAEAVWSSLLERGFRPDKRHILALMAGYADSGAMTESAQILKLAKEIEVEPTNAMWMTLLIGWARAGEIGKSVAAYRNISASGPMGADMKAVTAMIRAYYICGKYDKASYLVTSCLIPRFSNQLDKTAMVIAAEALRSNNQELDALDLVRDQIERDPGLMGRRLRMIVKQIKGWVGKKYGLQGREGSERVRALGICEEILRVKGEREKGRRTVRKGILDSLGKGRESTDLA